MDSKKIDLIRDEAFLLHSTPYGDYHRILSCLTATHGRVNLMVYSAQKSQKRFMGVLDFINCLQMEFKPNPRGGLGQLVNCELKKGFEKIRQSYSGCMIALYWIRLLSKTLPEGGRIPGLFPLMRECLEALEEREKKWVDLFFRRKFLSRMGYHLELSRCVQCGTTEASPYYFFPERGGLLCSPCNPQKKGLEVEQTLPDSLWFLGHSQNPLKGSQMNSTRRLLNQSFDFFLGYTESYSLD